MQNKILLISKIRISKKLFGNIISMFSLIMLLLFFSDSLLYAGDDNSFVPWNFSKSNPQNNIKPTPKEDAISGKNILVSSLRFYQRNLSPVMGGRCPMNPSCSRYSIQAINKHGFFIGLVMTADRLIHEADETRLATASVRGNKVTFSDPVENNDFWFAEDKNH